VVKEQARLSTLEWEDSISPWSKIVESLRLHFGETWASSSIAILSGFTRKDLVGAELILLFDREKPLCERIKMARRKGVSWWRDQLNMAVDEHDRFLGVFSMFAFLRISTIVDDIQCEAKTLVDELTHSQLTQIGRLFTYVLSNMNRVNARIDIGSWPDQIDLKLGCLGSPRLRDVDRELMYRRYYEKYKGRDEIILKLCFECAFDIAHRDPRYWKKVIYFTERLHENGGDTDRFVYSRAVIPPKIARYVIESGKRYPRALIAAAEESCQQLAEQSIEAVAVVAARDKWFHSKSVRKG